MPRALARTGSAALSYKPMKDIPMPSTTWTTNLTTTTNPAIIGEIRLWLRRNGEGIPSRDADVVGKYLRLAIDVSNRWGGVIIPMSVERPRPVTQPWPSGFEGHAPRHLGSPSQPQGLGMQLASVAFGLLIMLALYVAFAG